MKFYTARKPTYASRSLIHEVASIKVFLSKASFLNNFYYGWDAEWEYRVVRDKLNGKK
ncbi:hypothetical protein SAMN04488688_11080 [Paenibacillus sp. cl141a]|nr:hypothetical protein SAMN04488688_11080 [Paenibacillus sp. cl141a]